MFIGIIVGGILIAIGLSWIGYLIEYRRNPFGLDILFNDLTEAFSKNKILIFSWGIILLISCLFILYPLIVFCTLCVFLPIGLFFLFYNILPNPVYNYKIPKNDIRYNLIAHNLMRKAIDKFNSSRMSVVEGIRINIKPCPIKVMRLKDNRAGQLNTTWNGYKHTHVIIIDPRHINSETVAHEVSHWIDYQIRGNSYHDDFWERINLSCGGKEYLSKIYDTDNKNIEDTPNLISFKEDFSDFEYISDGGVMTYINYLTGEKVTRQSNPVKFHKIQQWMLYGDNDIPWNINSFPYRK